MLQLRGSTGDASNKDSSSKNSMAAKARSPVIRTYAAGRNKRNFAVSENTPACERPRVSGCNAHRRTEPNTIPEATWHNRRGILSGVDSSWRCRVMIVTTIVIVTIVTIKIE